MLNIIIRNYLRLLRAGCFGQEEKVEPMSAWKWSKAIELSVHHNTTALVSDGIERCSDQFFLQIPDRLKAAIQQATQKTVEMKRQTDEQLVELEQILTGMLLRPILIGSQAIAPLYDRPEHRLPEETEFFFPYETQGRKADVWAEETGEDIDYPDKYTMRYTWHSMAVIHNHRLIRLTNKLLGHGMQNLFEEEQREMSASYITINGHETEILSPTLTLFQLLTQISHDMLSHGIMLTDLLNLGILLRKIGHRIDYVKLQTWTDKLKMQRMLQLISQLMIDLLHFSEDEMPFLTPSSKPVDATRIVQEILMPPSMRGKNISFSQASGSIFVHASNTSAMMWHAQRSARFIKYYPSESITNFFSSFTHSLTDIEE